MKKFLLPLVALALSATAASAQDMQPEMGAMQGQRPRRSPDEMAAMQTKRLTRELSLTPDQATKVQAIVASQMQDRQAMREQLQSGDRSQMRDQMQAMRTKYESQYKAVLTPEQYTKMQAMQQQRGGGMGRPGMGQGGMNQSTDTDNKTKLKDGDDKLKIKTKPVDQ